MNGWFYGLVKLKNGGLGIWEITETKVGKKTILWAHPTPFMWKLRDIKLIINDLIGQWKFMKRLWRESEFDEWNKAIAKSTIKKELKQ